MPEMDGIELTNIIKQLNKKTLLVLVTAFNENVYQKYCDYFLQKPIVKKQIKDIILEFILGS
jgi:YesN/AraC family two-component response regulator